MFDGKINLKNYDVFFFYFDILSTYEKPVIVFGQTEKIHIECSVKQFNTEKAIARKRDVQLKKIDKDNK